MIDELYLYSYANEPNKSPWRERFWGLLPLRETATFPPQADHVLVVLFFTHGGLGGCVKAPRQRSYLEIQLNSGEITQNKQLNKSKREAPKPCTHRRISFNTNCTHLHNRIQDVIDGVTSIK